MVARAGVMAVESAKAENDLGDAKEDLDESKKSLTDSDANCKKKEWADHSRIQPQKLLTLADTIKVLNDDDDAFELLKRTPKRCQQLLANPGHTQCAAQPGSPDSP